MTGKSKTETNTISEITRRAIFDELRVGGVRWQGGKSDAEFFARIFDLASLPSTDRGGW